MPRENGLVFGIPESGRAPPLYEIPELFDSAGYASFEETMRPKVGIVLLLEHVGSQEDSITLARRCILCVTARSGTISAIRPSGKNSA
jgi:hypothetical protein